jgi:hypothetical protein
MGSFVHACEGEMVCESVNPKIPYFNAPIYLENKVQTSKTYLRVGIPDEYVRLQLEKLTKFWDLSINSSSR